MASQFRKTTRRRNSPTRRRGAQRPSLWDAIQGANKRARSRANRRIGKRASRTTLDIRGTRLNASTANTHNAHDYYLSWPQLTWRTFLALLLLIPSAISTLALFTITEHTRDNHFWTNILQSRPFLFFAAGAFLMLVWFWSKLLSKFFLYLYVLGHELTHVIFILLCGGKVSGFNVTLEGGYVMTNKSNFLIALSPYFIPFWSLIVLGISFLIETFWDIPYHHYALYLAIGATWTFHLAWTIWMIPRDQPDLKENGTVFSVVIIYMANVLLLAGMLCLIPGGLSFKSFAAHWISLFSHFLDTCSVIIQRCI